MYVMYNIDSGCSDMVISKNVFEPERNEMKRKREKMEYVGDIPKGNVVVLARRMVQSRGKTTTP